MIYREQQTAFPRISKPYSMTAINNVTNKR
jgi:hypothetical protein